MGNKMTEQNYLVVQNNVVDNLVVWDGDTNTWVPPSDATMLVAATTPADIWVLNADKTAFELQTVVGAGDIGFSWDGSTLHTNQQQPAISTQPKTSGTQTV